MRTLLRRLFIENWQRKLVALILAMIVWIVVNHSMTSTKIIHNVPVKVKHVPQGKTIDGLQSNGRLNKKIAIHVTGNKSTLDNLTGNDIEVIIDAEHKTGEWIATISKKNLMAVTPNIDLQGISKIAQHDFIVKTSNLVTESVPVLITKPIGEAPKGYQFLDIWPYQLHINLTGPEDILKKLKMRGVKLTFNLNEITKSELDNLAKMNNASDEVSYYIPSAWKKISLPYLSDAAYQIEDPRADHLRIDFVKRDLIPLGTSLPISLFCKSSKQNPKELFIEGGNFIQNTNGIDFLSLPLYAKGVSRGFVELVKDMMQLVIIVDSKSPKLLWNAQFIYPHKLENIYVEKLMSERCDEIHEELPPNLREEYLRNRFRSYMNLFRLYTSQDEKLSLEIKLKSKTIHIDTKTPFQ